MLNSCVFLYKRPSVHAETEELQETRQEELNRKFPERNNLALDLPSDIELYKLKRRIRSVRQECENVVIRLMINSIVCLIETKLYSEGYESC